MQQGNHKDYAFYEILTLRAHYESVLMIKVDVPKGTGQTCNSKGSVCD